MNDDEVGNAVRYAFHELKLVVEPGGVIDLHVRLVPKAEMARFQEEISGPVAGCPVPRIDLAERNAATALPAVMARLSIAPFL